MLKLLSNRTPQRWIKVLLLAIVVLNVLFFGSDLFYKEDTLNSIKEQTAASFTLNPFNVFDKGLSSQLRSRFAKVEQNADNKYWLAQTGLTETQIDLFIKPFLKDLPDVKVETKNSWINKNEIYYDPRFTLSIYLNTIKNKYLDAWRSSHNPVTHKGNELKPNVNTLPPLTLPFNWVDWLDLRDLNEDLTKPMDIRMSCNDIKKGTNNSPNPSYFCKDNKDLTDDEVKEMGFRNRNQLPGFIIHSHSSHEDRPFNDLRVLEGKCYGLTQNLQKPVKVIILTEEGGTFEFDVDESNNERMISSDMIHEYIKNNNNNLQIDVTDLSDNKIVSFDHTLEYKDLIDKVQPKTLADEEDLNGMYRTLKKQTSSTESKEVKLTESMFHYSRNLMMDQIEHYESGARPIQDLTANEQMYYNSLKYCSNFEKQEDEKTYFKMATIKQEAKNRDKEWGWHYDWRFFNGALNYDKSGWSEKELNYRANVILDRLLRAWNRFAEEKGIISWLMHGPLLSWYWNGLMFPFDLDIDIQMPMSELVRLAKDYNQTLVIEDPLEGYGKFLIDVGTFIHNRDISTKSNHIDARFLDVDSGIYIDITALANSKANPPEEYNDKSLVDIEKAKDDDKAELYNDRRKHFYKLEELSPLRYSMIEGVPVFVPSAITNRLKFEYSKGLTALEYNGWYFVEKLNLWVKQDQIGRIFDRTLVQNEDGKYDIKKLTKQIVGMSDEDVLRLLDSDEEILIEYYLSKQLTDYHDQEKQYLFDEAGQDNGELVKNENVKAQYNELVSHFKMFKPMRKALWDYENLERKKYHIN